MASSDSLLYVESVDANSVDGSTPLEHLKAAAAIVAERGHPAETIARTAAGALLTPVGFSDQAVDVDVTTGVAVAVRAIEASQWGLPIGADYVAHHWFTAPIEDPANFSRLEVVSWPRTYASRPGDQWGIDAAPVAMFGNVCDVRLTPDGRTAIVLQWFQNPIKAVYGLFVHDLTTHEQTLLTRLTGSMEPHGELSVSPDGRYAIVGSPSPQLVDLRTGHMSGFGSEYRAATFYPKAGPSHVLAVAGAHDNPPWRLVVLDLATFDAEPIADLPRRVDGIQVALDGTIAARMRPAGEAGWFDELVVSTDYGRSFEPVLPLRGRGGWRRRGTRPRWIEPPPTHPTPITLDPGFEAFLREVPPDNAADPQEVDWILDTIAPQIKHRVLRLKEHPPAAEAILAELCVLAALPALFDAQMLAAVAGQVVPVARAAGVSSQGRRAAETLAAMATGSQPPVFSVTFPDKRRP